MLVSMNRFAVIVVLAVACLQAERVHAENAPANQFSSKVMTLHRGAVSDAPNIEFMADLYEMPAGTEVPMHSHPGDEFYYVLQGEWLAQFEGQEPVHLKAGGSLFSPAGKRHGGKALGSSNLRLLGIKLLRKDEPPVHITPPDPAK